MLFAQTRRQVPGCAKAHHASLSIDGLLIDCNTGDVDAAARFWAEALGRPMNRQHPGSRGNYRM